LPEAERLQAALHGGENYELLFAASATVKMPRTIAGVAITPIGRLMRRKDGAALVTAIDVDGERRPLEAGGWEHFASTSGRGK
jgi:thiamine-monophosphate kinase